MLLKTVHDRARILFHLQVTSHSLALQFAGSDPRPMFAHCAANEQNVCPFPLFFHPVSHSGIFRPDSTNPVDTLSEGKCIWKRLLVVTLSLF
jgi:hypothetical protein